MRKLIPVLALAGALLVPATAHADDYECTNNPANYTVAEWSDGTYNPPYRRDVENFANDFGTTPELRAHWERDYAIRLAEAEAEYQQELAEYNHWIATTGTKEKQEAQEEYNECIADRRRERAMDRADERARDREYRAEQRRLAAIRKRERALRCDKVWDRKIWKSRASIPCRVARHLARVSSYQTRYAGWVRKSYVSGNDGGKLRLYTDAFGETRYYHTSSDPYMQAIWRKGKARVIVGSAGCEGGC